MEQKIAIGLLLISVLILGVGYFFFYPRVKPYALYGYAKSVPIQIGYDEVQKYWVLSATIDETTAFKLVLQDDTTESIENNQQVKTKSEVGILINPLQPYSKTNLVVTNLKYVSASGWEPTEKAPAFDINDAGWLTTAVYELGVWKNGFELSSQRIEVDYQKPKVVYLETPEGTVTVNNLGILPQGVEVPSGDLIIVYDPDGNFHVFNKADFIHMLDQWNELKSMEFPLLGVKYSWENVWNKAEKEGWLPQDVQLVHVSDVKITEDKQYVTLIYSGIAFAGTISVYVPEDLADTIIVQLFAPKPIIEEVTPDPLPKIEEGTSTVFWVKVRNIGTEGTVSISVSSTYYSFNPLTATTKNMQPDEVFTFKFEAFALNVEADTRTTSKIYVQGRGGSDTYNLKGEILNVEGYTPTIPEPTYTVLIVRVVDAVSYEPIPEIMVTINIGGSLQAEVTNVDGAVQFDLGQYTGDVQITTQETSKYPSKTEIVTVQLGTNEHTMTLGFNWWSQYWWLVVLAIILVVTVVAVIIYKKWWET
jgi:hypothetical protein